MSKLTSRELKKGRNRGKHPNDDKIFGPKWWPIFTEAVTDLSYLWSRGYGERAGVQLVGNRYKLNQRQRMAISRMSVAEQAIQNRQSHCVPPEALAGAQVAVDGFNLLILLENALSGAYVFRCRDGTYRDISSVHGSYKKVLKTQEAIRMVGEMFKQLGVFSVCWFFDKPVSNSGRLKSLLLEISEIQQYPWKVELVNNPDKELVGFPGILVSSDGWVLDRADQWFNAGDYLINEVLGEANIVQA